MMAVFTPLRARIRRLSNLHRAENRLLNFTGWSLSCEPALGRVRKPVDGVRSELDFSHSRAKRVGYARHPSAQREAIDAYPTHHDDTGFSSLRATVLKECLATCSSSRGRRHPHSWTENRKLHPARDGLGPRAALSSLPSRAQPCCMVKPRSEPYLIGIARRGLRSGRATRLGHRRDGGETLGQEDICQGRLPRPD